MDAVPDFLTPPAEPDFMAPPTESAMPVAVDRRLNSDLALERDRVMARFDIQTENLLLEAARIQRQLARGTETVIDHMGTQLEIPLSRERIASLGKSSDICFNLLKKTLPDLKQIVVTDETDNDGAIHYTVIMDGDDD